MKHSGGMSGSGDGTDGIFLGRSPRRVVGSGCGSGRPAGEGVGGRLFPRTYPVKLLHLFQGWLFQILKAFKKHFLILSLYFTAHFLMKSPQHFMGVVCLLNNKSYSQINLINTILGNRREYKPINLFPYVLYKVKVVP